jgi:hypothetical protein
LQARRIAAKKMEKLNSKYAAKKAVHKSFYHLWTAFWTVEKGR